VNDLHLRILHLVARRTQRELDAHDAVNHLAGAASTARRQDLAGAASTARRQDLAREATRTRARVADAQARRRCQGETAGPDGGPLANLLTDRKRSRSDRDGPEPRDERDQPSVK